MVHPWIQLIDRLQEVRRRGIHQPIDERIILMPFSSSLEQMLPCQCGSWNRRIDLHSRKANPKKTESDELPSRDRPTAPELDMKRAKTIIARQDGHENRPMTDRRESNTRRRSISSGPGRKKARQRREQPSLPHQDSIAGRTLGWTCRKDVHPSDDFAWPGSPTS